jgi:peptide/nickel transport system substrate-binding protein
MYQRQGTILDPAQRKAVVDQMQRKIFNDRPYIVLTYDDEIDAWSRHFAGFVESPQSIFNSLSLQSLVSVHVV